MAGRSPYTGTGLNLYIILVGDSGIGKDGMHDGISTLLQPFPAARRFVNFNDAASAPALIKAVAANPCFVNVAGEWGHRLKRLATTERDPLMQQLRRVLTNLYSKSGPTSVAGGIDYSDNTKNVISVVGAAFSMIGETTPDTFYEALTQDMMADGFMSRFIVIEYRGERPAKNLTRAMALHPDAEAHLGNVLHHAQELIRRGVTQPVVGDSNALQQLDAFENECDREINATTDQATKQMHNRAHLKVLRTASLLAVADNPHSPSMTTLHVSWALQVVRRDIALFSERIKAGDIGADDHTRETKLKSIILAYFVSPLSATDNVYEEMRRSGIVPRKYLQQRTSQLAAFKSHRLGATFALDAGLRSLEDSGYVVPYSKEKLFETFGFSGKSYLLAAKLNP